MTGHAEPATLRNVADATDPHWRVEPGGRLMARVDQQAGPAGRRWRIAGWKGTAMAGKFGLDPHQLDDEALERALRYLYATREETFFHGSRQALLNHTERMLQLEREYANRFPERTKADALRTRKGARLQAGQPTDR
jgi:Family of unknown function (DUF6158)